ncbi:MAG: S8/S53 family peptidase, partial [Bacteroidales bacterium]|nr:S8/S53 family peptidase [Bacteroidales bacterium]
MSRQTLFKKIALPFAVFLFCLSTVYPQQQVYDNHLRDLLLLKTDVNSDVQELPNIMGIRYIGNYFYLVKFDHFVDSEEIDVLKRDFGILDVSYAININGKIQFPTSGIFIRLNNDVEISDFLNEFDVSDDYVLFDPIDTTYLFYHPYGANNSFVLADSMSQHPLCKTAFVDCWCEMESYGKISSSSLEYDYLNDQWHIQNTGQISNGYFIDVNIPCAWSISRGNGVKVAIFDTGVELTHPNFNSAKLDWYSCVRSDTLTGGTGWALDINSPTCYSAHGTACAGIIGGSGIANRPVGVAPEVDMLSVTVFGVDTLYPDIFPETIVLDSEFAKGIRYAVDSANADVLNFSLGGDLLLKKSSETLLQAVEGGRNGKGCVAVVAAGNNDTNFVGRRFPYDVPGVIIVGAISPTGERKSKNSGLDLPFYSDKLTWGSNYGEKLDVVAPGEYITTNDLVGHSIFVGYNPEDGVDNDYDDVAYTRFFCGTSASAPMVSGVAALMLSVNPDLSSSEVKSIICQSTKKIRLDKYQYSNDQQNHPFGDWNVELGYGLVDACAAVLTARKGVRPDLLIRDSQNDVFGIEPNEESVRWNSPDIKLLDINTQEEITDINNYDKASCYVAVNIKNISSIATMGGGRERLYVTYGKPILKSSIDPLLPSWFPVQGGWVSSQQGNPITRLNGGEHGVATGLIPFVIPSTQNIHNNNILEDAFSGFTVSSGKSISVLAKWGFSLMAIADEGGGEDFGFNVNTLSLIPDKSLAKAYNSVAVTNGNRLLFDKEYANIFALAPQKNVPFQVKIRQIDRNENYSIFDFARINLLLSDDLMSILETSPSLKILDGNRVRIVDSVTTLDFLIPNPTKDYFIGSEIQFKSDAGYDEIEDFEYDVELWVNGS